MMREGDVQYTEDACCVSQVDKSSISEHFKMISISHLDQIRLIFVTAQSTSTETRSEKQ